MDATEKLRADLKPFNLVLIASEAGVCHVTLAHFRQGKNKSITAENYLKVKSVLDRIANDILGAVNDYTS
jgi:DNA-binding Xre family transcriptional regulator